jgi:hypothetical protein
VNYKVQYDRKNSDGSWEGKWSDVDFGGAESENSGGNFGDWQATTVNSSGGSYTSIAVGTDGNPVIAYSDGTHLLVTKCNDPACAGNDEITTTLDTRFFLGIYFTSIAIGADGNPVISYNKDYSLKVAKYVSSGGSGCASSAWTCTEIEASSTSGGDTSNSIAIDTDGNPVVAYYNTIGVVMYLVVAKCNDPACVGYNETITPVDTTNSVGQYPSIAIGSDGNKIISYYDVTGGNLKFARFVGSSGNCSGSAAWNCAAIDSNNNIGRYTSLAIGPNGYPVISYQDFTAKALKYIHCTDITCSSYDTPQTVDGPGSATYSGAYSSLAIDTDGLPLISYYDDDNNRLKLAKCSNISCSNTNRTIFVVDDPSNDVGQYTSLALGKDGYPVISYYDATGGDLKVAKMQPIAEIQPGWGISGANGDNLTAAAAGSCQGGTTWQDGEWTEAAKASKDAIDLQSGYCTELAFILDTSEAVVGTTYRLRLVTSGGAELTTYSQYPTFTVVSEGGQRYSKEDVMTSASTCGGGSSSYNCTPVDSTGDFGRNTSLAIGTDGNPVISYNEESTDYNLKVAKCNDSACSGGDETITTVDSTSNVGQYASIAIGTDGYPVISYYNGTAYALKVYHCTNASCSNGNAYTVDDPSNNVGLYIHRYRQH